jgi:hypothetical protein
LDSGFFLSGTMVVAVVAMDGLLSVSLRSLGNGPKPTL